MPGVDLVPGARHAVVPDGVVSTAWPRVRATCRNIGWRFDPWQDATGRLILAKGAGGKWAADLSILSIPRQVGKSYLLGCIIFALCLLNPKLRVIWTSHHAATTEEMYDAMKELAAHRRVEPHVLKCIALQGSRWRIIFRNGSRIDFGARERGFGRGKAKVGVLVLDEFQHISSRALANLAPTTNTADNPLILCAGTPPGPDVPGEAFAMRRKAALEGLANDAVYVEFSADQDANLDDETQWSKANPSYPKRTPRRALLLLRKILDEDDFRREALGIWDEVSKHEPIVSQSVWKDLVDTGPDLSVAPAAIAVDMSHRGDISIAGCWVHGEDLPHVEELWSGTSVADAVIYLAEVSDGIEVVVDAMSPAAQMIPLLQNAGRKVRRTTAGDMGNACLLFETYANSQALTHGGQDSVTRALRDACKRPIGDAGKWGLDRRDSSSMIFPLVAVVLALLGAESAQQMSGEAFFL
jgi:phage terminase large subunit-like protein